MEYTKKMKKCCDSKAMKQTEECCNYKGIKEDPGVSKPHLGLGSTILKANQQAKALAGGALKGKTDWRQKFINLQSSHLEEMQKWAQRFEDFRLAHEEQALEHRELALAITTCELQLRSDREYLELEKQAALGYEQAFEMLTELREENTRLNKMVIKLRGELEECCPNDYDPSDPANEEMGPGRSCCDDI